MAARFSGFPREAVAFFDDLERNNNKAWFTEHKATYEQACREPMKALLEELEPKYGPGKIFRINRDVRFSADKSPYKTNIAASFGRNYVSLSSEGMYVGSGVYMPGADALQRYRDAVVDDASGKQLEKIAAKLEANGYELGAHDTLKSAPRGYPKDHPRVRFLRHKGLYAWKGFAPAAWFATRKAYDTITDILKGAKPLNDWLDRHVGADEPIRS